MKIEDPKIGMRVSLCRTLCAKQGWSEKAINYYSPRFLFGRIDTIHNGIILVQGKNDYLLSLPNVLVCC